VQRRAFDWVLIVVLTGVWAVLFARGIGDGVHDQRGQLRTRVSSASGPADDPTVLSSTTLLPGDRLLEVDGRALRGRSALYFYDRAMPIARERGSVRVGFRRGETELQADLTLTPSRFWWTAYLFSASLMAAALIVWVHSPQWHLAQRYLVASWLFAIGFAAFESHGGPSGTALEVTVAYGAYATASALTIWNVQDFSPSVPTVPGLERAIALVPALLYVANYVVRYLVPYTLSAADFVVAAPNVCLAAGVVYALTRTYVRSTRLERRQVRWVVLGFYIAMAGAVIGNTVALGRIAGFLGLSANEVFARVAMSALGCAAPLGVLASVIGYRWLDVDRLISATASYTLVALVLLGAAVALVPRVALAASYALGVDAALAQWILTMALLLTAVPAHLYLWPQLDRRMFAVRHQRMSGLELLIEAVGQCASAEQLWRLASGRIDELLEPGSLVVYARDGDRFAARFARSRSATPYDSNSLLVHALERRGWPLAADSRELDPFDRAALETLGVALVVPIHAGEHLVAFACLGRKRSGDIYTREETSLLAALAARCGERLATEAPRAVASGQVFRREGDLWTITSRGKQVHLRDMRGLHYLATLLREPGREFAALDLAKSASPGAHGALHAAELTIVRGLGGAGPALDARARAEFRARLTELEGELADAERCADLARRERASAEREALLAERESAARGRGVAAGSDAERARIAVTKAIKAALEKVADAHPELGAHLAATVHRGHVCAYQPDPRDPGTWDV
jgi:hypothetical protein